MIVGSKHNQPKARLKDKKKKTKTDKIYIPHRKRKKKTTSTQLSCTDHNQKPLHNKHINRT